MRGCDLTGEFKRRWEEVMDRCEKDWEDNVPKPQGTFDQRPDIVRKQILDSYIPELKKILEEAEAAQKKEKA